MDKTTRDYLEYVGMAAYQNNLQRTMQDHKTEEASS